jgi:hypothetical protein
MRRALLAAWLALAGCASAPSADPSSGVLWGYVRLIPKSGTEQLASGSYGDRRVSGAERTDYSQVGFAVAYVETASPQAPAPVSLAIEPGLHGPELRPAHAAVRASGRVLVVNHTDHMQVVSAPLASWLRELQPGETGELALDAPGEIAVHLLGADALPTSIWVSPGDFAVVEPSGRYELRGISPGPVAVRAWHPRLPPSAPHALALAPGQVARLDLEIGVDRREVAQP